MFCNRIKNILNNKTVRNGTLFSLFSFFNRGIAFLLLIVLAEFISPEQYGELSLFNTLVMLLGYFVGLSTAGYLSVSFFKSSKEDFAKDITAICTITCFISVIFALFFVLFSSQISDLIHVPVNCLYIGIAISFFNIFVQLNLDYLRVQEKVSIYGILSCSFAVLNFIFSIYLVVYKDLNWYGRVYSQLCCDMLFAIIAFVYFYKDRLYSFASSIDDYKRIIVWGLPIIPHLASGWVKQGLDRYIINEYQSLTEVGLFSFALNIASVIIMIGVAFNQTNSVSLYQTLSSNLTSEEKLIGLKKKERYFSLAYVSLTIVIVVVGSIAIPLFMPKYAESVPYFVILSVYGLLQCVYFIFCNYLFYYNKTRNLMYITLGTSLLHLALSFLLTRYSLYLTCCVNVFSIFVVVALVYKQSRNLLNKELLSDHVSD